MSDEATPLRHHVMLLGDALGKVCVALGVADDVAMTGPQLLLVAEDAALAASGLREAARDWESLYDETLAQLLRAREENERLRAEHQQLCDLAELVENCQVKGSCPHCKKAARRVLDALSSPVSEETAP